LSHAKYYCAFPFVVIVFVLVGSASKVQNLAAAASCLGVLLIPVTAVSQTLKKIIMSVSMLPNVS
jgi:hypothetical protein